MTQPTIIEQPSVSVALAAKAKFWRKNVLKISQFELASRTGYSVQMIQLFERGYDQHGRALKDRAWRKYRLICAGLSVPDFSWGDHNGKAEQGQEGDGRVQAGNPA